MCIFRFYLKNKINLGLVYFPYSAINMLLQSYAYIKHIQFQIMKSLFVAQLVYFYKLKFEGVFPFLALYDVSACRFHLCGHLRPTALIVSTGLKLGDRG